MFWEKNYVGSDKPISSVTFISPPPPPKEVAKIQKMLTQVETWIKAGETELAAKHWILISDECRKYGS